MYATVIVLEDLWHLNMSLNVRTKAVHLLIIESNNTFHTWKVFVSRTEVCLTDCDLLVSRPCRYVVSIPLLLCIHCHQGVDLKIKLSLRFSTQFQVEWNGLKRDARPFLSLLNDMIALLNAELIDEQLTKWAHLDRMKVSALDPKFITQYVLQVFYTTKCFQVSRGPCSVFRWGLKPRMPLFDITFIKRSTRAVLWHSKRRRHAALAGLNPDRHRLFTKYKRRATTYVLQNLTHFTIYLSFASHWLLQESM